MPYYIDNKCSYYSIPYEKLLSHVYLKWLRVKLLDNLRIASIMKQHADIDSFMVKQQQKFKKV